MVRQEEEQEVHQQQSSHMESKMVCTVPVLNTQEQDCVTAQGGVSYVHHTDTSWIKIETDVVTTHTLDLKNECLDGTELGYVSHLLPDEIKTVTSAGAYIKVEHDSDLLDVKWADIKADGIKCEASESLLSDMSHSILNTTDVKHEGQSEISQCEEELFPNGNHEAFHDLQTQYDEANAHSSSCVQYGKKSPLACNLSGQLGINSREKPYKCTQEVRHLNDSSLFINNKTNQLHKKIYECNQCRMRFYDLSQLNDHLRIHSSEKPHRCTACGKCFNLESQLTRHVRIHTGEKPFKCTRCRKRFNHSSSLYRHLRTHLGREQYSHTQHKTVYQNPAKSIQSKVQKVQAFDIGEKPFKCIHCGRSFNHKSSLCRHRHIHFGKKPSSKTQEGQQPASLIQQRMYEVKKTFEVVEKPHKCIYCGRCFNHRSSLSRHQRIHAGEQPSKRFINKRAKLIKREACLKRDRNSQETYECVKCGMSFPYASHLSQHMVLHTSEKLFKCTQCGKCFSLATQLKDHQRIHAGGKPHKCEKKPYSCGKCGKSFSSVSNISLHLIVHFDEKPYKCTQCGKTFNYNCNFRAHKRRHAGETYNCGKCGRCFYSLRGLKQHMIIHLDTTLYKCTLCQSSFKSAGSLKTHLIIHKGEKPHKCTQCGKCFSLLIYLNNHLQTHTEEKHYKCTNCGKSFRHTSSLSRHQRMNCSKTPYGCAQRLKESL